MPATKITPVSATEEQFVRLMKSAADDLAAYADVVIAAYPSLLVSSRMDASRTIRPVTELIGQLRVAYARQFSSKEGGVTFFLERLSRDMQEENKARWKANMKSNASRSKLSKEAKAWVVTQEPGIPPAVAKRWTTQQLSLIKKLGTSRVPSIPADHFERLTKLVQSAVQRGLRVEELRKELKELDGITKRRAEVIARDQTVKYNGKMTQIRHEAIGVKAYFWRTAGDGRVRPEHAARGKASDRGVRFYYDKPPKDGHPGQAVQCRCWADPDLESALKTIERKAS